MSKYVLFMALSGLLLPACGEEDEKSSPGGVEGEGEGSSEGDGEGTLGDPCPEFGNCPEGLDCCNATMRCVPVVEAEKKACETVKDTPTPAGADGEPCGAGGACEEGLSCLTCEEANLGCDGRALGADRGARSRSRP